MANGLKGKMIFAVLGIITGVIGVISSVNDVVTIKQEMNETKENN